MNQRIHVHSSLHMDEYTQRSFNSSIIRTLCEALHALEWNTHRIGDFYSNNQAYGTDEMNRKLSPFLT